MWGSDRGFRLGVADRRFRTDKGLGFGSSLGAVLFAHGTSPTRLNMKFGSGSSDTVLVLIYNAEGIAYAITAEGQPSRAARSRAPLGAVRWILVFPPGGAEKIFPLP